jgi:hypothetical protein
MDLSIDFIQLDENTLKVSYKPKRIWINFWGKRTLLTEDYANILKIFGKFDTAEIIMMNLDKRSRKNLKDLFQDYSRIKVLEK